MTRVCDGTTQNGWRNCNKTASWSLRIAGDGDYFYAACNSHLAQMGRYLLDGEQGSLEVRSDRTYE